MSIITTTALLAQKQRPVQWNQKTAIKNFLKNYQVKFDIGPDEIDLRAMSKNYPHGIIPLEDIHQGLLAVLGPNYNPSLKQPYSPMANIFVPPTVVANAGHSPSFAFVKWDQLYLYSIFQRDVGPRHISKLNRDWDHTCVIVPCAIKFTWNGKEYYCLWDGHHTIQTAKIRNYTEFPLWYIDIDRIPSNIITAAQFTDDEEGRIKYGCWLAGQNMIRINATHKKHLEHYDRFMIQLETGDAKANAMNRIITSTGCIPRNRPKGAGSWTQINAGEECYDLLLGNGLPSNGVFWQHSLEFHRRVWPASTLILEVYRPLSYLYQAFNIGNYPIDAQFDTELETILTGLYGDADSVQQGIKDSFRHAIDNNLGRGTVPRNDKEIVYNGLINLYNQKCGRLVAIPQPTYVWQV